MSVTSPDQTLPPASPGPSRDAVAAKTLGRERKRADIMARTLCLLATALALGLLASILLLLLRLGLGALTPRLFTTATLSTGSHGGLANAIVGSLVQVAIGTAVGTPIGLLVGTFLAEYARVGAFGNAVRFVSDVLLSAPSILIGLFVYQLVVMPFGGFSGWAGALSLAVIVIPIVVRTTEDMLRLVPDTFREAVIALGAPKWKMITLVCWRAALSGIVTGLLLAIARIAGETAPLLFTSLGNNGWARSLSSPYPSLPVTIYAYAGSPYQDWIELAWAGALLITLGVLALNVVARTVLRPSK